MYLHCPQMCEPPMNLPTERPKPIYKEEAVQKITDKVIELASGERQSDTDTVTLATYLEEKSVMLGFYVEKLVADIRVYCHRCDFPEPLIYTAVEIVLKQFNDELAASTSETGVNAPLSEIKQDDVTFKFAVATVDVSEMASEKLLDRIKPKLNLYRKVKSI